MGSDDLFKKRRKERKKRSYEYKTPRVNSFLIVTEGERTEPLYFGGMKKLICDKMGGTFDVVDIPSIDICGQGSSTGKLIEITDQLVKDAKVIYQNVWVVFDKDDFLDFDYAIKMGENRGYNVAWSNQSFEYWIYLHFHYSDAALHREDWNTKLDELFRKHNLGDGNYRKNYESIYSILAANDGVNIAISNAKCRMNQYNKDRHKPSEFDPGTTVYKLVEILKCYLDE